MMKNSNQSNLLFKIWNMVGTIGGIVSLASMAEGIISWKGFLLGLIDFYRSIVHGIFNALLIWLPFTIPPPLLDYITVGLMINLCLIKSGDTSQTIESHKIAGYIAVPFITIGWPMALIGILMEACEEYLYARKGEFMAVEDWLHSPRRLALIYVGMIALGFMLLFILNLVLFA